MVSGIASARTDFSEANSLNILGTTKSGGHAAFMFGYDSPFTSLITLYFEKPTQTLIIGLAEIKDDDDINLLVEYSIPLSSMEKNIDPVTDKPNGIVFKDGNDTVRIFKVSPGSGNFEISRYSDDPEKDKVYITSLDYVALAKNNDEILEKSIYDGISETGDYLNSKGESLINGWINYWLGFEQDNSTNQ